MTFIRVIFILNCLGSCLIFMTTGAAIIIIVLLLVLTAAARVILTTGIFISILVLLAATMLCEMIQFTASPTCFSPRWTLRTTTLVPILTTTAITPLTGCCCCCLDHWTTLRLHWSWFRHCRYIQLSFHLTRLSTTELDRYHALSNIISSRVSDPIRPFEM